MALDVLEQIHEQCSNGDLLQSRLEQNADAADEVAELHVDTFLMEALNSRNRITVLRLEQEIERFARNACQQDLLLKPMQSSYERLAAHRIAQHYGLQSMVVTAVFPKVSRILLVKTGETKLPSVRLADIPVEGGSADKRESITNDKIAIKQRANNVSDIDGLHGSYKSGKVPLKTMEEREEEYDKARARIFNGGDAANSDNGESGMPAGVERQKSMESSPSSSVLILLSDGKTHPSNFNRVAILRDREKDMKDPDYDRSYRRYPQLPDLNGNISFPNLHRVYSPTSTYEQYIQIDGQWARQLQLEQLSHMPALPFNGLRMESCYRDTTYMHHGQSQTNAYWQCATFPPHPHNPHFNYSKDGFCLSFQHGPQSATTLGALGR